MDALEMDDGLTLPPTLAGLVVGPAPRSLVLELTGRVVETIRW